jgi:WD40 repeat protein
LSDPALGAVFSPDRRTLATGTNEGHVKLWSVTDGTLLANLGRHEVSGRVSHLVFAPDGRTLATECESQIKVWDVPARRQRVAVRFEKAVSSVALGPDGRTLAVALNNGIVKLIDAQSGQERGTLHGGEDEGVLCLAFSPDGATLAAAGDDRVIRLWDLATARQRQTLVGHSDWVQSLAFTPDGKTLASAGRDGTLRFWSPVSGHELLSVETPIGMQHLVFSRDGKRLAGGGSLAGRGGEVYLWSAAGGIPGKPPAGKEEKKTR